MQCGAARLRPLPGERAWRDWRGAVAVAPPSVGSVLAGDRLEERCARCYGRRVPAAVPFRGYVTGLPGDGGGRCRGGGRGNRRTVRSASRGLAKLAQPILDIRGVPDQSSP